MGQQIHDTVLLADLDTRLHECQVDAQNIKPVKIYLGDLWIFFPLWFFSVHDLYIFILSHALSSYFFHMGHFNFPIHFSLYGCFIEFVFKFQYIDRVLHL